MSETVLHCRDCDRSWVIPDDVDGSGLVKLIVPVMQHDKEVHSGAVHPVVIGDLDTKKPHLS